MSIQGDGDNDHRDQRVRNSLYLFLRSQVETVSQE